MELLVFRFILFQHVEQLLLLLHFDLGLLFVSLDLLLELFSLVVNLSSERVFNTTLFSILFTQLSRHEFHLFDALFLELFVLDLEVRGLLLDHLVFLLRFGHILSHLRLDSAKMLIKVLQNLLPLRLLVILDLDVALLELRVLTVVLTRDLLVLLADDISFVASILIFQCLLVEELLLDLSFDRGSINLLLQWLHLLQE